ncbi:MAG: hypothetical protein K0R39_2108 [Symbiobacteriaceae bacterium]|jgi:hypothetical protein|nr:hypothetical protein [Symbiobacteriaceae bacterium]
MFFTTENTEDTELPGKLFLVKYMNILTRISSPGHHEHDPSVCVLCVLCGHDPYPNPWQKNDPNGPDPHKEGVPCATASP